jgi:hypothetical protein
LLDSRRRVSGALNLAVGLWSLKNKRNHTIQRRGGFSPPHRLDHRPGRAIPAPTLLHLFFKDHQPAAKVNRRDAAGRSGGSQITPVGS